MPQHCIGGEQFYNKFLKRLNQLGWFNLFFAPLRGWGIIITIFVKQRLTDYEPAYKVI